MTLYSLCLFLGSSGLGAESYLDCRLAVEFCSNLKVEPTQGTGVARCQVFPLQGGLLQHT